MSDYIRPIKGMWLTNVQFLGGRVIEGKAYQVTSGAGEANLALYPFPGSDFINEDHEFSFVDDSGTERYSTTNPNLFLDEWQLVGDNMYLCNLLKGDEPFANVDLNIDAWTNGSLWVMTQINAFADRNAAQDLEACGVAK